MLASSSPHALPSPGLTILVPVYNSAPILPELAKRLEAVLRGMPAPYEVLLINDGSRDESWNAIVEIARRHAGFAGIGLMRNFGQHHALLAGIRAARYATIVTMDDDLQHPPEELPRLLAHFVEGYDVVYGPPLQEQHGVLRDLASVVTKLALRTVVSVPTAREASALRVFRTELRDAFAAYHSPFVNIDVLLSWGAVRYSALRVRHDVRSIGKSNYTVGKLLRHAANMLTGFSVLPLQLASLIGFVLSLFGAGVLAYVLLRYLIQGSTVAGFPFLASIIAIFSGAQLFALGIIGEYLARIHFRTMDKPAYVVKQTTATPVP